MKKMCDKTPPRGNRGGGRRQKHFNKKSILFLFGILIFSLFIFISASFLKTITQSDFDEGTYNQTYYNTTYDAVQINLSYNSGNYTSKVFDMGSPVTWDNLSWHEQRISCPEGMAYINKLNGFCIDKYEASCWNADGTWNLTSNTSTWNGAAWTDDALANNAYANSSAGKYPWVRIDRNEARIACENHPDGNKHLCTDDEWLAAANIKGVVFNLDLELTDCTVNEATDCDWADSPEDGDACMTGSKADCVSSEGVYDMVGNVWEWTNETVGYTNPCPGGATSCYWNGTVFTTSGAAGTAKYGNDITYFTAGTNTNKAVLRGGFWYYGALAGPFCARLYDGPSLTSSSIGFRCCRSS